MQRSPQDTSPKPSLHKLNQSAEAALASKAEVRTEKRTEKISPMFSKEPRIWAWVWAWGMSESRWITAKGFSGFMEMKTQLAFFGKGSLS